MTGLYVTISSIEDTKVTCNIETSLVLFIYKYLGHPDKPSPPLYLVIEECEDDFVEVDITDFKFITKTVDAVDSLLRNCYFPVYSCYSNYCISGFCAVLRQLVKTFEDDRWLLGFREACLSACAEFSVWTKFCEVDLISSTKEILTQPCQEIPKDLVRLEYHLLQPVKTHNISKKNFNFAKKAGIPFSNVVVEHSYVEGDDMCLSDLIIFPLVNLYINLYGSQNISTLLPSIFKWYNLMLCDMKVMHCMKMINCDKYFIDDNVTIPEVKMESLYKCDPKRYKANEKLFTKQQDIEKVLKIIDSIAILEDYEYNNDFILNETLDWDNIPYHAHPKGGNLPDDRLFRKMHQIENVVKSVLKIAEKKDVIVDFCCGGGHVGVLLAYLLPECEILLLDNKEHSLLMARKRINSLALKNVFIIQSNIDYFKGSFQIGVTLHACGVATDLVINNCISKRSKFVVAPCCYGKLQQNHILNYPKSEIMNISVSLREYMVLGHSADQTHKEEYSKSNQGEKCMKSIDVDRCLHAKENNYQVHLAKMVPVTCSPKNNLIVGLPKELM